MVAQKTMRGLAKTSEQYGSLELVQRPVPTPGPNEALVRIRFSALCGSDVRIYTYEDAYEFMEFPLILGHEFAGEVVEVGDRITHFQAGDRVIERPMRFCGNCYPCRVGCSNICVNVRITGAHHDGGFAEYISVPESALHRVPDDLPLREASMVEPASVAVRAVDRNSRLRAGDRVLVQGPGPIGLLVAQVARGRGGTVRVAGVNADSSYRLPLASELGFDTVNVEQRDLYECAAGDTGGQGYDLVFDATGHPSALPRAVQLVRRGGQIVVIGQAGQLELDVTPMVRSELDLQFSYASTWEDFERAIRLLLSGEIESEGFLDDRFSMLKAEEAFEAALEKRTCKPVFDNDELTSTS